MLPTQVRRSGRYNPEVDDFFNGMLRRWWGEGGDGGAAGTTGVYPVDVREDQDHIYVDAELPGFKREEIEVTLENGMLHIAAERRPQPNQKGEPHLQERRFTRVARSFTLPNTLDEGKVDAKLEDGVLHLTLHKREEVKPRRIEVK
jgi:HSP20 family protein